MDEPVNVLFCLTCSSGLQAPDIHTHQSQDHIVVKISVVEDGSAAEVTEPKP